MGAEPVATDQIEEVKEELADAREDVAEADTPEERRLARERAERIEAKLDQLIADNKALGDRVKAVEVTPVAPAPKPAEKPADAPAAPAPASAPASPAGDDSAGQKKRSVWWGDRG